MAGFSFAENAMTVEIRFVDKMLNTFPFIHVTVTRVLAERLTHRCNYIVDTIGL